MLVCVRDENIECISQPYPAPLLLHPVRPPLVCNAPRSFVAGTPARTPDSVVDDLSFANLIGRELASQYSSSSSSQMPACIDTADSPDSASNSAPPSATGTTPLSLTKPQIMSPLISSLAQLDTAFIATRVRELLAANNIGQRVFAKYVLGLSQGTVSELLSKPKHWDKLTEKGRDSYRKMASWAAQDSNITALRAYSPRKGLLIYHR